MKVWKWITGIFLDIVLMALVVFIALLLYETVPWGAGMCIGWVASQITLLAILVVISKRTGNSNPTVADLISRDKAVKLLGPSFAVMLLGGVCVLVSANTRSFLLGCLGMYIISLGFASANIGLAGKFTKPEEDEIK